MQANPKKIATSSAKNLPRVAKAFPAPDVPRCVNIFVAEDFREENGNKVSAVGLYTTRAIVLNLPADVTPSDDKPVAIMSLCFLVAIRGFLGPQTLAFSFATLSQPDRILWTRKQVHNFSATTEGVNLIVRGQPFFVGEFGPRLVVVDVGDHRESVRFDILRGAPRVRSPEDELR